MLPAVVRLEERPERSIPRISLAKRSVLGLWQGLRQWQQLPDTGTLLDEIKQHCDGSVTGWLTIQFLFVPGIIKLTKSKISYFLCSFFVSTKISQ